MDGGTLIIRDVNVPSWNDIRVGFVVRPYFVHLVDSHKVLSPRFAILRLRHTHLKITFIVNCYSSHSTADEVKLDAFDDQLGEIIHTPSTNSSLELVKYALQAVHVQDHSNPHIALDEAQPVE
ncbi:unnamed protein product [Haemonchus placei]|uniref:Reverse transcriptase n=1 Tax=Haemonchus placei TaxID=6290 RepID=A0A0N4W216_HAEPC|nr:unnamed protein product [Haemonchus placei]